MKRFTAFALAALLALSAVGCGASGGSAKTEPNAAPTASNTETTTTAAPEETAADKDIAGNMPYTFTDDLGREVTVTSAERVGVLIGSFADIWCLAGGKDAMVATSHNAWTELDLGLDESVVDLGAIKEPDVEALLDAEPDFVIGSTNTAADVDMEPILTAAGIPVAYFDVETYADFERMFAHCCAITGDSERLAQYGTTQTDRIAAAVARQDDSHPSVLYIRAAGSSIKVKNGSGTVLGEMLTDLGCTNIADSADSLLENLSLETIIENDPEWIFIVVQGQGDTAAAAQDLLEQTLLTNPAWNALSAVQNGKVMYMEHVLYNMKPNGRWAEAYEGLADILYPAA